MTHKPDPGANPIIARRWEELAKLPVIPVTDTTLDDAALFAMCCAVERLPFWTLTNSPSDHQGKWVARLGFGWGPVEITQNAVMADTRAGCEAQIPLMGQGRWTFIPRHDCDEPQIVGVWI